MVDKIQVLLNKKIFFFDGAMGTMLQRAGLLGGEIPETYNIIHPEIIENIHSKYIDSGADILTTNTFGANRLKLKDSGYSVQEVIMHAVKLAKNASKNTTRNIYTALDIGPIGQLMEPSGTLCFEEAYDIFKEQIIAGCRAGVDIILIETMSDLHEAKAAILAAKENSNLPVFCTMTFDNSGRTLMGTDPKTMTFVLQSLGVDVLGVNCSLGPKEIVEMVDEILKYSIVPVMVQPNAGLPCYRDGNTTYDISPNEFAHYIKTLVEKGVNIVGGCCGTTPDYIEACKNIIGDYTPVNRDIIRCTSVCSSLKSVIIDDGVSIIGERINPTGKRKFKEAILNNNIDYILNEAINQKEAGADILDVNVGLPEINEKDFIVKVIKEIQGIIELPLQIDSANIEAIEAAARIYNGKPIINSVNGKLETMEKIFPIVKKYGGVVVGLTLDEKGIPSTAEERVKIAERIINTAKSYGIDREDILIDCLTLTASAAQAEVMETIKAVKIVKEKFGVKTVLGVSNVSFGLPQRDILNKTFLAMALAAGLNAPIINPLSAGMIDTINSFKVLTNQDKEARKFIKHYNNCVKTDNFQAAKNNNELKQVPQDSTDITQSQGNKNLMSIIIDGIKEQASVKTEELLKKYDSIEIIDNQLIPALNIVGQKYENKEIYLPQLIQSAETVKKSFEVIKASLMEGDNKKTSKGRVLLATVKGDIHDIGKNIVKILLENYGYEIIDLGRDVSVENIVDVIIRENIKIVGLSALMTTTVKSMEETIKAIRKNAAPCSIVVGGAVLTQEYAEMIGADFYAKDAMEGVRIVQSIFSN